MADDGASVAAWARGGTTKDPNAMDWSAPVSAFLGGSLGTLITGWFDRRAPS
jgi:hypothetical protein